MNRSGYSLYAYLGLVIVSVVVSVVVIYSTLSYFAAKNRIVEELQVNAQATIASLQKNIASYIEAYAINEYDMLIATEMDNPDLLAIVVSDRNMGEIFGLPAWESGKIRDAQWNVVDYDPENSVHAKMLQRCFHPVSSEIVSDTGEQLGALTICNSDRAVERELHRKIVENVRYAAIISMLLVLLLFFTIRRIVLRPVAEIVGKLGRQGGDVLPQADMPEGGPQEIATLGRSINNMIRAIHDREHALQQSESRFRLLVENIPAMVFLKRAEDLRYDLVNSAAEKILGYSRADLLGKNDHDLFDQAQADSFTAKDRDVLEKHQTIEIPEEAITVSDGSIRFLQTFKTGLYGEDGRPTHLLGVSLDVTEQKRMAARDRKLTQAIEQSGEAVLITDAKGTIEFVNAAFCTLTGYTEKEAVGRNPRFLKGGNPPEFYRTMWEKLAAQGLWQGRIRNRRKDGSIYPALLTISAIANEQGETVNYIGVQRDLTEFEALEEQFRQAQKMEAVGTLVGGIAHDFNNMLAGITGNLYLLRQHLPEDTEAEERLDTIENLSFRAAAMIKQLLTFSRKEQVNMSVISIGSFLKEFMKLHRVSVPENVAMESEIPDPSILVEGDVTQLQQVMLNLINNARDALEGVKQPKIVISVEQIEADERFMQEYEWLKSARLVKVCVQDNGCGIPEEKLTHIFEPFFTTKGIGKGTGLGLAMVYGAIRAHGGAIKVVSQGGVGTTVCIYLPIAEKRVADEADGDNGAVLVRGRGETILLADDDQTVRDAAGDVLQSMGYRVLRAANGRDAVAMFAAHPEIDLLVFDVVMPEMGGVDAAEEIRRQRPNIRVIFATGYESGGTLNRVGDAEVVYKPFRFHDLAGKIRALLDR